MDTFLQLAGGMQHAEIEHVFEVISGQVVGQVFLAARLQSFDAIFLGHRQKILREGVHAIDAASVNVAEHFEYNFRLEVADGQLVGPILLELVLEHGVEDGAGSRQHDFVHSELLLLDADGQIGEEIRAEHGRQTGRHFIEIHSVFRSDIQRFDSVLNGQRAVARDEQLQQIVRHFVSVFGFPDVPAFLVTLAAAIADDGGVNHRQIADRVPDSQVHLKVVLQIAV